MHTIGCIKQKDCKQFMSKKRMPLFFYFLLFFHFLNALRNVNFIKCPSTTNVTSHADYFWAVMIGSKARVLASNAILTLIDTEYASNFVTVGVENACESLNKSLVISAPIINCTDDNKIYHIPFYIPSASDTPVSYNGRYLKRILLADSNARPSTYQRSYGYVQGMEYPRKT